MEKSIVVLGAGAVGSVIGADLTRAGLREAAARLDGIDLGLDGPLSSLVRPAPVEAAAVGRIDLDSITAPFGIPATEPYFTSVFAVP